MASYEQSKSSKLWSVRFREDTPNGVKNKRLSGFKTKKDAQAGYIRYMNEKPKVVASTSDKLRFADLIRHYLSHTKTRVKSSSYYDIESKISKLDPSAEDYKYSFDFETEESKNAEFAIGAYVVTTQDGQKSYLYLQEGTPVDGEKYAYIKYNDFVSTNS